MKFYMINSRHFNKFNSNLIKLLICLYNKSFLEEKNGDVHKMYCGEYN